MAVYRATQAALEALLQSNRLRTTLASAEFLRQRDQLRVTQVAVEAAERLYLPTAPELFTPPPDGSGGVDDVFRLTHGESSDELDRPITYFLLYKKATDSSWTIGFEGRVGTDPFELDSSLWAEGTWQLILWAEAGGEKSGPVATTFTVNHGWPSAPVILTPSPGEEFIPDEMLITWEHSVDPEGDPLQEFIRYRAYDSSTWIPVFDQAATEDPEYLWDIAGLPEGKYVLQMYANDGASDGPPAQVIFNVLTASRPSAPAIRIGSVGTGDFCVQIREYKHPYGVPWKATVIQVRPYGGDWSNPTRTVSTEDPASMLEVCLDGLATGFHLQVRAWFVDENDAVGPPGATLDVSLLDPNVLYEKRWDESVRWSSGQWGTLGENELTPGAWKTSQPLGALVDVKAPEIGSVRGHVFVMLSGCQCGYGWQRFYDCEFRESGFALAKGLRSKDTEEGVALFLRTSFVNAVSYVDEFEDPPVVYQPGTASAFLGFRAYKGGAVVAESKVDIGKVYVRSNEFDDSPVLPWWTWSWAAEERVPFYKLEFEIQRYLVPAKTVLRAKVAGDLQPILPPGQWQAEWEVPDLLVCGFPGFVHGQQGTQPSHDDSADSFYKFLDWVALRDKGIEFLNNPAPLDPVDPEAEPPCVVQPEDPIPDPVLWPGEPQRYPIRERVSYLTDVIEADDDTEQRIQLRERPAGGISYASLAARAEHKAHLEALIWEQQPARWGVPLWMDGVYLAADLASGAGSIPAAAVDVGDRRFAEVEHVALWVDPTTYHLSAATLEVDGSITLEEVTTVDFPARRTRVIPVRIGRMGEAMSLSRRQVWAAEFPVDFRLETMLTPPAGDPPPSYQGFDLLTPQPNRAGGERGDIQRSMTLLDGHTGEIGVEERSNTPVVARTFHWTLVGRPAIDDFRAWLDRRKGRAVPFWAPTWMADLTPTQALGSGSTSLIVKRTGYTTHQFPDPARRHLALILPDQTVFAREVMNAVDNGDGTETLTLSSALGVTLPATGGLVSFLPLYRLDNDEIELEWKGPDLVTVHATFRELPREAAAL